MNTELSADVSPVIVRLTEAPGQYEAIKLNIQGVQLNSDDYNDHTWVTSTTAKGVYELNQLHTGKDTLLSSTDLLIGKIARIKIVFGKGSTVRLEGKSYPLEISQDLQNGLILPVHAPLIPATYCNVLLDVNAFKSVVYRGNGHYLLQPALRASLSDESGTLRGIISPSDSHPLINAISGTDTVSTTSDMNGNFSLCGLHPGAYAVIIQPSHPYQSRMIAIAVEAGKTEDVGIIRLQ